MEKIKHIFSKPYVLLFLSAFLSALPQSVPSLFLLSWVSFVPFFAVLLLEKEGETFGKALKKGLFFGFFYHFFIYYWFLWLYPLTFAGFGKASSLALVLFAWMGISLVHGAFYMIPTFLCHLISKKVQKKVFLLFTDIFGVLLAEKMSEVGKLAFPWVKLSLSQYRAPVLIQSASLFGITGLDFVLLSFSALITLFLFLPNGKKKIFSLCLALFIFSANLLFGVVSLSRESDGEEIRASLIQGNILVSEKFSGSDWSSVYTDLTKEIKDSDLVLWPESAIPVDLSYRTDLLEKFQSLSDKINTPILLGSFWEKDGFDTNSAVLITSDTVSHPYAKRHLVPFGEGVPYKAFFSAVLPGLENLNLSLNELTPGEETALFGLEQGKLGAIICFESLFPALTRESVQDGAEMMVLLTNDSWYKDSPAVYQHLAHSVFRSVENGRATLRCANSGVSAVVDEKGQIGKELGPLRRGVLSSAASFSQRTTFYTAVGDLFLPVIFIVWCILFAFLIFFGKEGRLCRKQMTL